MATATSMTVEQFAALPEDGQMHELVEGELLAMPPPQFLHSRIVSIIFRSLSVFLARNPVADVYAEAGFQLFESPPTVRQPDIGIVGEARLGSAPLHGYYPGAPDAVFEVVSPSDRAGDLDLKVRQYLDAGSKAVVVVYPQTRTVWVHRPQDSPKLLGSGRNLEVPEVLPGWSLPVADIFAPLDEIEG